MHMSHDDVMKEGGQSCFLLVQDTRDRPLVQPKMEEWTSLCFPLRNAGTSGLFFLKCANQCHILSQKEIC